MAKSKNICKLLCCINGFQPGENLPGIPRTSPVGYSQKTNEPGWTKVVSVQKGKKKAPRFVSE
jgi:hypothetical protein